MSLLRVESLHKTHRRQALIGARIREIHAVVDVSFEVARGEILGIVGESGSGKSTLARALLYLDPPTSGAVIYDGHAVGTMTRSERRDFRRSAQIVFQDPHAALDPRLRVATAVAEGLPDLPRNKRDQRAAELLSLVGIDPGRRSHYPHEFSGGQKQRIVIARALAVNPRLLILDEPVSNLDVSIQAQIVNLLMELKQKLNLTYVFISHDLNLVGYVSDRIGVMKDGRLVEIDRAEVVLSEPKHSYTQALFANAPVYVDRRTTKHTLHQRSAP